MISYGYVLCVWGYHISEIQTFGARFGWLVAVPVTWLILTNFCICTGSLQIRRFRSGLRRFHHPSSAAHWSHAHLGIHWLIWLRFHCIYHTRILLHRNCWIHNSLNSMPLSRLLPVYIVLSAVHNIWVPWVACVCFSWLMVSHVIFVTLLSFYGIAYFSLKSISIDLNRWYVVVHTEFHWSWSLVHVWLMFGWVLIPYCHFLCFHWNFCWFHSHSNLPLWSWFAHMLSALLMLTTYRRIRHSDYGLAYLWTRLLLFFTTFFKSRSRSPAVLSSRSIWFRQSLALCCFYTCWVNQTFTAYFGWLMVSFIFFAYLPLFTPSHIILSKPHSECLDLHSFSSRHHCSLILSSGARFAYVWLSTDTILSLDPFSLKTWSSPFSLKSTIMVLIRSWLIAYVGIYNISSLWLFPVWFDWPAYV